MARTPFQVEVLTPEGEVFNDEVEMVSTKTTVGSIDSVVEDAKGSGKKDEKDENGDEDSGEES